MTSEPRVIAPVGQANRDLAIPETLSIYLDLVRFMAAVFVLLHHSWARFYPDSGIKWPGHEAVVVFFVLSGYVITHAATRPGMTAATYIQHRMARILPVAYLGLILGLLLSLYLAPAGQANALWWPWLANMLFIAQSGWMALPAPGTGPIWSLNYEVWYYIIFGIWLFTPRKWRTLATALALLAAGPKILMLFPVWLYGVLLYKKMPAMSKPVALAVFILTLIIGAVFTWSGLSDHIRDALYAAFPPLWRAHFSTQFVYDILLGIAVFYNFAAVHALAHSVRFPARPAAVIRNLASYTFSLYIFHAPLIVLMEDILHVTRPEVFYAIMAVGVVALGQLTEKRTAYFRALLTKPAAARPALKLGEDRNAS